MRSTFALSFGLFATALGASTRDGAGAGVPPAVIHRVDEAGVVGLESAVRFGADGLPLVAYYDETNGALKAAHCATADCSASTRSVLDSAGDVGSGVALAIGADGLGIASYIDHTNGAVKVARCLDAACTAAAVHALGPALVGSPTLRGTAIAVGPDGRALVAFTGADTRLTVARCADAACSSATRRSLPVVAGRPALVIGGDGLPLVAADDDLSLFVLHCTDADCAAATGVTLTGTPAPPFPAGGLERRFFHAGLAVGADGRGVLVNTYYQAQHPSPVPQTTLVISQLRRCADAACSSLTSDVSLHTSHEPALVLASGDRPLVAHRRPDPPPPPPAPPPPPIQRLAVTRCVTADCASTPQLIPVDDLPFTGFNPSIALAPNGVALVSYFDESNGDLVTAYLEGVGTVDLSPGIVDTPDPVVPGQTLEYDLLVTNTGAAAATGLRLRVALPPGTQFAGSVAGACTYDPVAHAAECVGGTASPGSTTVVATVFLSVLPVEPGTLSASATVSAVEPELDPGDNAAIFTTSVGRWLASEAASAVEGNAGMTPASFRVALHDTRPPGPPVTVSYATGGGTAQAGTDYLAAGGALTFVPGAPSATVEVAVLGDAVVEGDETFELQLAGAQGASIVGGAAAGTIVDDDVALLPIAGELGHGTARTDDLASGPRHYRLAQAPHASYEVVVDAGAGDAFPLALDRLAPDGSTVLQSGSAPGTGASARLAWTNTAASGTLTQLVRVRGGCPSPCDSGDVFRVRAYDTTARVARFNNTAGQVTALVLQNPSDRPVSGRAWFRNAAGGLVGTLPVALGPWATAVLDTTDTAAGVSGSVSIAHDGPYGVLRGKAVALEPATGLAFDTPLEVRPR